MKSLRRITDPLKREQLAFADSACVRRTAEAGLDLAPIGAINARKRIGKSCPILIYNAGASTAFVKFGANDVAAASTAADGIPVLAGEKFMLNSGANDHVIGSSSNLYAYVGDQDQ